MKLVKTVAVVGVGAAMAFAGFGSATANAATATANLAVSATVTNNCTISTKALAFGAYDPVVANASTNLDGLGGIVVACTKGASADIGLGLGANMSGTTRRMVAGGTNYLTYELYQGFRLRHGVGQRWHGTVEHWRCAFEGRAHLHGLRARREQSGRAGR